MSRTGNVKVAFRLRPMNAAEQDEERYGCIHVNRERGRVAVRNGGTTTHFNFDKVYDGKAQQETVYNECVSWLVRDFLGGRNCSVIAYGESGSGKTYSILGPAQIDGDYGDDLSSLGSAGVSRHPGMPNASNSDLTETSELPPKQVIAKRQSHSAFGSGSYMPNIRKNVTNRRGSMGKVGPLQSREDELGVVPRLIREIFDLLKRRSRHGSSEDQPSLRCSFLEVYNERVVDLLDEQSVDGNNGESSLVVKSDPEHGVFVDKAIEEVCFKETDVYTAVEDGMRNRTERTEGTGVDTSKSHSVIVLKLERYSKSKGRRATSSMFLVDLANSALVHKPPDGASSQLLKESKSIKRSLGALRKCLRTLALSDKREPPPHTESALTRLLHDSLVRGAGVSVIVTANPLSRHVAETLSAIRYGIYVGGHREKGSNGSENSQSDRTGEVSKQTTNKKDENDDEQTSTKIPISTLKVGSNGEPHERMPRRRSFGTPSLVQEDEVEVDGDTVASMSKMLPDKYEELEKAGELLQKLPDDGALDASGREGEQTRENFARVSNLLTDASKRMEKDLDTARKALQGSNFDGAFRPDDMEKQLEAVTKEFEQMKYGGHLSDQIQKDLLIAQQELKQLSMNAKTVIDAKATIRALDTTDTPQPEPQQKGATNIVVKQSNDDSELSRLREEVKRLERVNKRLVQDRDEREDELILVRKSVEALRARISENPTNSTSETTDIDDNVLPPTLIRRSVGENGETAEEVPTIWGSENLELGPYPIKVCLRLRPMTRMERNRRSRNCIEVHDGGREFTVDSPIDGEYDFCFDDVFDVDTTQEKVFQTIGIPMVEDILSGVNCTAMAYGLAGSGKSHTLLGKLPRIQDERSVLSTGEDSATTGVSVAEKDAGFYPRVMKELFKRMREASDTIQFRVTCNYLAIFLEKMFDLLDPKFDKHLVVKDGDTGIEIENATEAFCFDEEDLIQLGRRGDTCRKVIGNKLNIEPSRSHALLFLRIEQRHIPTGCTKKSYLQLAELAGFEVTSKAKGQSVQETKIIHKSFSALGNVIKSITEGNPSIPYREAKLTSVLKDAFGGNSKAVLFITASPSSYNISETINSIRLGQRVRRVTNHPRVNKDLPLKTYKKWLIETESKLGELSSLVKDFSKDMVEANKRSGDVSETFSSEVWKAIEAIAEEEECVHNPCRKATVFQESESDLNNLPKWRWMSSELSKRMPSDKLVGAMQGRDKAESLVADIQSESVVLRRQNELLVQEKRKKIEELNEAHRENRQINLKNSELEHKLNLAETRARDAMFFVRYMRTISWKLRKNIEKDRPVDIDEITQSLSGAPDLTGLVDLDSLMVESGIIESKELDLDKVENEFANYLESAGLVLGNDTIEEDAYEIDEQTGTDGPEDDLDGRWARRTVGAKQNRWDEQSVGSKQISVGGESKQAESTLLGAITNSVPWLKKEDESPTPALESGRTSSRLRRREWELQKDLQTMANKCVELQVQLNTQVQLVESLTNRAGSVDKRKLAKEAIQLSKDRDRMLHKAKAATWKLQELHVTNKLLQKQASESKQQNSFLEEGFQKLQASFRVTVQDGLDADAELRDRARGLQSIVDSLTGPTEYGFDEEQINGRLHVPIVGRTKTRLIGNDQNSDNQSPPNSLIFKHVGKRLRKRPVAVVNHSAKFLRKTRRKGTALIGSHRNVLTRAAEIGESLYLAGWLEDDDDDDDESYSDGSGADGSSFSDDINDYSGRY